MSIAAIQPSLTTAARTPPLPPAQLNRPSLAALQQMGRMLDPHDPAVVRHAAAQMVSELFFKPLLAEMRDFPFGEQFGSGGRGEAVFGEQLDQYIADAVAAADRDGLVAQLTRRLQNVSGPADTPADQAARPPLPVSWLTRAQAQESTEVRSDDAR